MTLRIRPFVNGGVEAFDDLPFYDPIGSVRRVNSLNKDYICVSQSLYTAFQWLEFDGTNIIGPQITGGPTLTNTDELPEGSTNLYFTAARSAIYATLAGAEALTNKTYNGNTWTAGTGILTMAAGKTLTLDNSIRFAGADGVSLTLGASLTFSGNFASTFTVTGVTSLILPTSGTLGVALVPTAVKTANYTAAANDFVPVNTTSGAITVTLPTAPPDKTRLEVKHVIQGSTNAVTVTCGGSDVFNKTGGSTSITLPLLNQAAMLQYTAATGIWYLVADNLPLSGLDSRFGALEIPSNPQSAAYTCVLADSGKSIDHPSTDANARTFTIPANASVPYPIGTCLSFSNLSAQALTIAINSDTLIWKGTGATGSRTVAQNGDFIARKIGATTWMGGGTNVT